MIRQLSLGLAGLKTKGPSEYQIERSICDYLKAKKLFFWKTISTGFYDAQLGRFRKQVSPYARKGVPDILLVYKGKLIGIEIKSATGRLSDSQRAFGEELLLAGGIYFVARSIEDVQNVLGGFL